mmetsp:Transcript_30955/g.69923  ORF Transcript_30955/g.69923 Transcript_30955/m.69923 type:complete len:140 (+) Transcript_30955:2-421(+)
MRGTPCLFFFVVGVSSSTPWRCDALKSPLSVLRPVGRPLLSKLDDAVDGAVSMRGGGNPQSSTSTGSLSQGKRRQLVVVLVATALFNDMLQVREGWSTGCHSSQRHRHNRHLTRQLNPSPAHNVAADNTHTNNIPGYKE